jgi:hypothetical protein
MGGKAKPTKHTSKEIAMKHHESKMKKGGRGGGLDGKEKRLAPKEGKRDIFLKCEKCFLMQPSLKSMQIHYESKHPKENWDEAIKIYDKSTAEEEGKAQDEGQNYNEDEEEDETYQEVNEEEEKETDK